MTKLFNISILFLFVLIVSCEDKFINDLDITVPPEELLTVINLDLNEGDAKAETFVARTYNVDEGETTFYDDALVELYKDDELFAELIYEPLNRNYIAFFENNAITEGEYRVEVSGIDGLKDISSTQTIPPKVNVNKGVYEENGTIYQAYGYAESVDEALITFDDPADQENYYLVKLYVISDNGDFENRNQMFVSSINPVAETVWSVDGILLKDDSFNGKTFDLSIGFYNYLNYNSYGENTENYLEVELINISKDNYLYLRSFHAFQQADGNPFAEPVVVHNNIENGIGIFRTGNASKFRIDL